MKYSKFFIASLLFVSLFLSAVSHVAAATPPQQREITKIKTILKNTGNHLAGMQKTAGNYYYEYNPFSDEFSAGDNDVRQVGTTYGMSQLFETFRDRAYLDRMKKTAEYWLAHSQREEREAVPIRYLPYNGSAKLGTSALFIIGTRILKVQDPAWWSSHLAEIQEIENFLFWMQKSTGGFAGTFTENMTMAQKEMMNSSDYYDGEAMLALITLYKYEGAQKTKDAIYKTLNYFEDTYVDSYAIGLYLWAMTAMHQGYLQFHDERFGIFAERQQELKDEIMPLDKKRQAHNVCTNYEGLGNWLLLQEARDIKEKAHEEFFVYGLSQMSRLQLKTFSRMEFSLDGIKVRVKSFKKGVGGFITDIKTPVQRIDFQQHCIAAFKTRLDMLAK